LFPHSFDVSERGEFLTGDLFNNEALAVAFFSQSANSHAAMRESDLCRDFQAERHIRPNIS
jgi:hypothetical protein